MGKAITQWKKYTAKQVRSLEKFDRNYAPTSDEEEDEHRRFRELASFANYKTDNVHYNTVQDLMMNRKHQITTTKKDDTIVSNSKLIDEFLYPGDIIEFIDIHLYSNLIYAVVLSTSYDEISLQKSITTTCSSFIELNHVIRRVRTTSKTNKIIKIPYGQGQYMELGKFNLLTNSHKMNDYVSPPTDGMVLKYIQDMSKVYAENKLFVELPSIKSNEYSEIEHTDAYTCEVMPHKNNIQRF